ncbi:MAG: MBL fold metallo-hydrolase [Anaerolineales bacterium]|nr:MAG: MBL fold metallo-hydrolase [Anaerolineales bacterium]
MNIVKVRPGVIAVDRPGATSNVAFVRTGEGVVVIDTTSKPEEMKDVLNNAGIAASDAILVIITHADPDHIGGNKLFDCPILAHRLTRERMAKRPKGEQPTETFESEQVVEIGGVRFELTHKGGHKVDASVVWLPEQRILFPGDLVFEGRYPYMLQSDVPTWMDALRWLPSFGAEVILPGHGTLCGDKEVALQLEYMEATWNCTADHVRQGHGLKKTLNDPDYPRYEGWLRENLFEKNIEVMYEQLKEVG